MVLKSTVNDCNLSFSFGLPKFRAQSVLEVVLCEVLLVPGEYVI
jgi:hypothetical protein